MSLHEWHPTSLPPLSPGWYKVRNEIDTWEAAYVRNGSGQFKWLIPDGDVITEWAEINTK